MAEVLYYTIKIDGIDNETKELGALEVRIKELTKELNNLTTATNQDTQAIGETKAALALATKERKEYLAAIKKPRLKLKPKRVL